MKLDIHLQPIIKDIANTLNKNSAHLYLVGGSIRDFLLGITPHDFDFCVTGITEEKFENLFPEAIKQGKSFPVYILNNYEFALARKEKKTGNKHTDFSFDTSPTISIIDDLSRRDLTINSMAMDVISQELIDPFNGFLDLENKIFKMTSTAFEEDPLRVYRTARFAAQFNFKVDLDTINQMQKMKNSLSSLSSERVCTEFRKALTSKYPANFFDTLRLANCLTPHFAEIENLINVEQPIKYHPEGDVYNHSIITLKEVANKTTDELIRFCALVHDFGKAATPKENWPHHYNHDKLGVHIVKNFCNNLNLPTIFCKAGCLSSKEHMLAGIFDILKIGKKVDFIERVYNSRSLSLEGLELIANVDTIKNPPIRFAQIGEDMMKTIKITNEDKLQAGGSIVKIKEILKQKRIHYLQSLLK